MAVLRKALEHRVSNTYIGRHVTADFWGCDYAENSESLLELLTNAARMSGATVLNSVFHEFEPSGMTCILLLAESHISIHTWPEYDYVAIDIFTCGRSMKPEMAVKYLEERLKPTKTNIQAINRGRRTL